MSTVDLTRRIGRRTVVPLAYHLGVPEYYRRRYPSSLTIACYHGVAHESSMPYSGRHLPAATFEKHMAYFRKHFDIVPLKDALRYATEQHPINRPTLAVTFDDGYLNNAEVAAPILNRYQIPATIFVSSICIDNPDYLIYADVLDILREDRDSQGLEVEGVVYRKDGKDLVDANGTSLYQKTLNYSPEVREATIRDLISRYDLKSVADRHRLKYFKLMSADVVRNLNDSPLIDIAAHGHRHFLLDKINIDDARSDLVTCKTTLEAILDQPIDTLAFPAGSYTAEVKSLARACGFSKLIAEGYRLAEDETDPGIARRISISGTTNYYSNIVHYHQNLGAAAIN